MTNREKLLHTNLYDLLCRMNESIKWKKMQDNHDIRFCIMDVLDDVGQTLCNGVQMSNRDSCGECIERYLNKECE